MITKTATISSVAALLGKGPGASLWHTSPYTMEERLVRIEALGQRITGYVQFMCQISNHNGASVELREKAVADFYERLTIMERQLGRVQEELQLG